MDGSVFKMKQVEDSLAMSLCDKDGQLTFRTQNQLATVQMAYRRAAAMPTKRDKSP